MLSVYTVTVIESSELEKHQISEETVYSWCVDEQVMDLDISVLQQVEELELRVTSANLQVKVLPLWSIMRFHF